MRNKFFSDEQIKILLENPNVEKCSNKSIKYTKEFKINAVKEWYNGIPPRQIFIQAGFDINIIGKDRYKDCLSRWRKIYNQKGEKGLKTDGRGQSKSGGRPRRNWSNDKDKIKYLEAEIAYLKAENDFLAKLRKKS